MRTFIYGSYDGRFTFLEPMVALSFLRSQPDFMTYIKSADWVDRSGYYPTHYQVKYDPHTRSYTIALVDLEYRQRR